MKVLIACEESGTVREAFKRLGHDAWSCDLLPSEIPGQHIQDDVLKHLDEGWDLMIAHPPCTHLAVSGARWFKEKIKEQNSAVWFFNYLVTSPIKKWCVENPIGIMSSHYRKPDQIIQPWQFGHPESKSTCLWLRNLPKLKLTKIADFKKYRCKCGNVFEVDLGKYGCCDYPAKPLWDNMTKSGQNKLAPSEYRAKDRARTYQGIANAMAQQWGTITDA